MPISKNVQVELAPISARIACAVESSGFINAPEDIAWVSIKTVNVEDEFIISVTALYADHEGDMFMETQRFEFYRDEVCAVENIEQVEHFGVSV